MATSSSRRRSRLIRQLKDARDLLDAWDASLRTVAVQITSRGESSPQRGEPGEMAVLLAIVDDAKHGLDQRLAELGADSILLHSTRSPKVKPVALRTARGKVTSTLDLCVKACRACGKALGAAFREAQSLADLASLRVLYGAIRDLEKQLWVLDPRQAN